MLGWIDGQRRGTGLHKENTPLLFTEIMLTTRTRTVWSIHQANKPKKATDRRRLLSAEEEEVQKPRPLQSNAMRTKKINLRRTTYNTTSVPPPPTLPQRQRGKSVLYEKPRYITKEWSCNCVCKSENAKRENCWWKTDVPGLLRPQGKFTVSYISVPSPFVTGSHSLTAQLSRRVIRTWKQRENVPGKSGKLLSRELLSIQEQGKSIRENYEPSKYALQNEPCGDIEEEQGGHRHWKESFARSSQYSQLRMVGNESECEFSSVVVEEWEGV